MNRPPYETTPEEELLERVSRGWTKICILNILERSLEDEFELRFDEILEDHYYSCSYSMFRILVREFEELRIKTKSDKAKWAITEITSEIDAYVNN